MKTKTIFALLCFSLIGMSQIFGQTGMWTITKGSAPDGSNYTGSISVGSYQDTWNLKRQVTTGWTNGIGINVGQSVYFACGSDNAHIFVFQEDGTGGLSGKSTDTKSMGKTGSEIIKLASLNALEGSYTLEGKKAGDGGSYTGTISFTKFGDIYNVKYVSGTITKEGIGFISAKVLAVAFGKDVNLTEYVFGENSATGKTAQSGFQILGSESITK